MNKLFTTVAVLEHELSELRLIVERQTGILLDTPSGDLSSAVSQFLQARHLNSASELLARLRSSAVECESFVQPLLDGETGFFRHPGVFEAFAKAVLPDVQLRKSAEHVQALRIWSAGCSTGEEAYSIGISVCEIVNCASSGWQVHIVASDIRRQALQVGERGLYSRAALEHVPQTLLKAYFARVGEHFLVKPRLRNLVTFAPMNLAQSAYIGRFDCIFCMDVLPHFSMIQRTALLQRLHLCLEPGGYLLLGQGEKLPRADVRFDSRKVSECIAYQKPRAAVAAASK